LVTDSSKNIITAITYHPFGETFAVQGSEHYLFNGKELDSTGLYYYGARYYDPELGRFVTRDPLRGRVSAPQSLNRYTYVLNNPLRLIDPWGLIEDDFSIEGGGEQEEPEIIGDPSYDGNGEITIPTSMGDVTIDLDTTEDWGDVDDKAKQNQVREEFDKLEQGREKYREYQAEKNRDIRKKYSLMGMGETPEMECDGCDNYAVKSITASLGAVGGGLIAILGSVIYGLGAAEGVAVLIIVGAGLSLLGLGLFVIGISLAVYYGLKWVECKRGSS